MKKYYRLRLGATAVFVEACLTGNFIGTDFDVTHNLTHDLGDEKRAFIDALAPIYLVGSPGKSKIAVGKACGTLWTVSVGIEAGDIVLCPDSDGRYRIGELTGDYYYAPGQILPHRRPVRWLSAIIDRADMSETLRKSTNTPGTLRNISSFHEELEKLIGGPKAR